MTTEDLQALCESWQRILRLQDWDITVDLVRLNEMPSNQHVGNNSYLWAERAAKIKILDPVDIVIVDNDKITSYDLEESLVHEMLHPILHPIFPADSASLECACGEQAINQLAQALVKLKRKGSAEG